MPTGICQGSLPRWATAPSSATVTRSGSWPTTEAFGGWPGQRAATWATASGSDVDGDATWVCSLVSANTQRPATAAGRTSRARPAEA